MSNSKANDDGYWIPRVTPLPPLYNIYDNLYQSEFNFIETGFSVIQMGYSLKDKNKKVFLKFIKNIKGRKEQISQEICLTKQLSHNHILNYEYTFNYKQYICVVTPAMPFGTLQDILAQSIRQTHKPINESLCKDIMYQLLLAVNYLHKLNIIHRDIKPSNVFVSNWLPDKIKILLSDFGIATHCKDDIPVKGYIGSYEYIPPEVYQHKCFSKAGDIWASGILLFSLLTGRLPFPKSCCLKELKKCVKEGKLNMTILLDLHISFDCRHLINEMLQYESVDRITAENALKHPWFNSVAGKYNLGPQNNGTNDNGKINSSNYENYLQNEIDPSNQIIKNEISDM